MARGILVLPMNRVVKLSLAAGVPVLLCAGIILRSRASFPS
jgi:hypothetical protein